MRGAQSAWACAALLFLHSTSAHAAECWTSDIVGAARIREMEVMVMAVGLRCRSLGFDITASLEKFRTNQKSVIQSAEAKLRGHYGTDKSKAGKLEYDRFLTRLGNFYGGGVTDKKTCTMFELIAEELAKPGATADDMEMMALNLVQDPQLGAERCAAGGSRGQ